MRRLRTWIVAVAVLGAALGSWELWQRREHYLRKARFHHGRVTILAEIRAVGYFPRCGIGLQDELPTVFNAKTAELHWEFVAYHRALERKYAWAADYPWLVLAPDPPPPEFGQAGGDP